MIGTIIGDIVGSVYEGSFLKTAKFPFFGLRSGYTDDTVLTVVRPIPIWKEWIMEHP